MRSPCQDVFPRSLAIFSSVTANRAVKDVCGVCRWSYGYKRSCYCFLIERTLLILKFHRGHHNRILPSYLLKSNTMIRFLFLHILLVRRCFCQLKKCYNIGGGLVADLPCDPSANVSACCGQDYTCSTNFYCTSKTGFRLVGSCTDRPWHDPACPLPLSQSIITSFHPVISISNSTG